MASTILVRRTAGLFRYVVAAALALLSCSAHAATTLSDQPIFTAITVPGNLLLSLSVEYPTALSQAYPYNTNPYTPATTYLGYFDGAKCYTYVYNTTTPANGYFQPYGAAAGNACTSTASNPLWSGNWLNWAAMQTIDTFRWALTGGYRSVDTPTSTILEKAYASGQGGNGETPNKTIAAAYTTGATPFTWSSTTSRIWGLGNQIWVSGISSGSLDSTLPIATVNYTGQYGSLSSTSVQTCIATRNRPSNNFGTPTCTTATTTAYNAIPIIVTVGPTCVLSNGNLTQTCVTISPTNVTGNADPSQTYALNVRVQVCNNAVGLESNCVMYGSNYKPQGLMQQYASTIRFGAFGYLNDPTITRDGGVLRASMKYIGPQQPVPGSNPITNSLAEWSATDGTFITNPNPIDAAASGVSNSGVMNYLNKFGEYAQTYKVYDPVSELYYAGIRYFKNLGNWSTYTSGSSGNASMLDGFPVITSSAGWVNPIIYSCQKNFILGIGDTNTHADANLPGSTITSSYETSAKPNDDNTVNVTTATNMIGNLEGVANLGSTFIADYATNFMGGLAYDSHVNDIQPNNWKNSDGTKTGIQTISTYWLDVQEYQTYTNNNQFYYATKYGGFTVPNNFVPYASTNKTGTLTVSNGIASGQPGYATSTIALADSMWHTTTDMVGSNKRPDNYFSAGQADKMVSGLKTAFASIANQITASGNAFSTTSAQVATGNTSYATQYSSNWTGNLIASTVTYDSSGNPTYSAPLWTAQSLLQTQSSRKIVTCCTTAGAGLPFEDANLNNAANLNSRTNYASFANVSGVAAASQSAVNYLGYLRGNQALEVSNNGGVYRTRPFVLGDIVDSKANPVPAPASPFSESSNPGYSNFKSTYATRKTVVYVGANDGMMHAFDGSVTPPSAGTGGTELFAYVPSFVYGTTATAPVSGLASLGRLDFTHHFLVDGTPQVFDIDTQFTGTAVTPSTALTANWKSILIGSLGKGGQGYYAIDVTDPSTWSSETTVASKVLWEFTDPHMGYSYGDPVVVKTRKYGWVAILTSGYNNDNGIGYFYFVNPATGALLETVSTGAGSTANPSGLTYASAYVADFTDGTADSVYAGDLLGNLWRLDLTPSSGSYAAPTQIASLTDGSGNAQPVTTIPLIEVQPNTFKRYVLIGTGRLLSVLDIPSTQTQTFYSIVDGTSGAFYTSATLPVGITYPITRSNLVADTITQGIGATPAKVMGWYFDLDPGALINIPPTATSGLVAFAANIPNGNVCSSSGSNKIYAANFGTGLSIISGSLGYSTAIAGMITDLHFLNVNGSVGLQTGNAQGSVGNVPTAPSAGNVLKRLNWREIPTSD